MLSRNLQNFRRPDQGFDCSHPDQEIAIWEAIAEVYQQELAERPDADQHHRKLLYKILLFSSINNCDLNDLIDQLPEAASLPGLANVIIRLRNQLNDRGIDFSGINTAADPYE